MDVDGIVLMSAQNGFYATDDINLYSISYILCCF